MVEKITVLKNKKSGKYQVWAWNTYGGKRQPDYVLADWDELFDARISARLFRSDLLKKVK